MDFEEIETRITISNSIEIAEYIPSRSIRVPKTRNRTQHKHRRFHISQCIIATICIKDYGLEADRRRGGHTEKMTQHGHRKIQRSRLFSSTICIEIKKIYRSETRRTYRSDHLGLRRRGTARRSNKNAEAFRRPDASPQPSASRTTNSNQIQGQEEIPSRSTRGGSEESEFVKSENEERRAGAEEVDQFILRKRLGNKWAGRAQEDK